MADLNNEKNYVKNSSILINGHGPSGCRIISNSEEMIVVPLGILGSDVSKIEKLIAQQ